MPAPLVVLAAVVGAAAAVIAAGNQAVGVATAVAPEDTAQFLGETRKEVGERVGTLFAYLARAKLGLDIPLDDKISKETLTIAINKIIAKNSGLSGAPVEFANIFDKDAVKSDVKRIGLQKAFETFGYDGGQGVAGLRQKIITDVLGEVHADIAAGLANGPGASEYIAAAKELQQAIKDIAASRKRQAEKQPLDMSPRAVDNRERQRRYAANHTRVWIER